ncbi:hypothetical protein [Thetidibacter halocola]|uniref:Peptidase M23 n=1 Tax=Thetidibacter halocola TaxID=2827239 RepID=A0A8J8BBV4_9RHOB|nr:hypothetical protein [Thetidibacter halocola]MBS0126618.1 hypothetical protein [Thetidibacter halocola]
MRYVPLFVLMAGPALAHPGVHVHPHDGASWLTVAAALAVLAVAGGVALARVKGR